MNFVVITNENYFTYVWRVKYFKFIHIFSLTMLMKLLFRYIAYFYSIGMYIAIVKVHLVKQNELAIVAVGSLQQSS